MKNNRLTETANYILKGSLDFANRVDWIWRVSNPLYWLYVLGLFVVIVLLVIWTFFKDLITEHTSLNAIIYIREVVPTLNLKELRYKIEVGEKILAKSESQGKQSLKNVIRIMEACKIRIKELETNISNENKSNN